MQTTSTAVPDLDSDVPPRPPSAPPVDDLDDVHPRIDAATLAAHRAGRPAPHQRGLGRWEVTSGLRSWALIPGGFLAVVAVITEIALLLSPPAAPHLELHVGALASVAVFLLGLLWPRPPLTVSITQEYASIAEDEIVPEHGDTYRALVLLIGSDTKTGMWMSPPTTWTMAPPQTVRVEAAVAQRTKGGRVLWRKLLWVRLLDL